jgi:hypothetical protein
LVFVATARPPGRIATNTNFKSIQGLGIACESATTALAAAIETAISA